MANKYNNTLYMREYRKVAAAVEGTALSVDMTEAEALRYCETMDKDFVHGGPEWARNRVFGMDSVTYNAESKRTEFTSVLDDGSEKRSRAAVAPLTESSVDALFTAFTGCEAGTVPMFLGDFARNEMAEIKTVAPENVSIVNRVWAQWNEDDARKHIISGVTGTKTSLAGKTREEILASVLEAFGSVAEWFLSRKGRNHREWFKDCVERYAAAAQKAGAVEFQTGMPARDFEDQCRLECLEEVDTYFRQHSSSPDVAQQCTIVCAIIYMTNAHDARKLRFIDDLYGKAVQDVIDDMIDNEVNA